MAPMATRSPVGGEVLMLNRTPSTLAQSAPTAEGLRVQIQQQVQALLAFAAGEAAVRDERTFKEFEKGLMPRIFGSSAGSVGLGGPVERAAPDIPDSVQELSAA